MSDPSRAHWTPTTLESVVQLQRGHDLPARVRVPGSVPIVGSGEAHGWHNEAIARGPGVIIGRATNLGRPKFVREDYWPLNTTLYVKDFLGNEPRWVYYLFRTLNLTGYNSGSVQPMLNRNYIQSVPVLRPPIAEQRAIAEVLGALDDKIEANRHVAEGEDALAQALFGLVRDLPAPTSTITAVASVVLGGTPSRDRRDFWEGGTVPWINSGKANDFRVVVPSGYITDEALRCSAAKLMPRGTTIVAITGATLGRISRLELATTGNQSLVGVWADDPAVNDWLYFWIRSRRDDLTKHATGGAQQHINKGVVEELPVCLPTNSQLMRWHARCRPLLDSIAALLRENLHLTELRDALLPKLLSGELRIRDADALAQETG